MSEYFVVQKGGKQDLYLMFSPYNLDFEANNTLLESLPKVRGLKRRDKRVVFAAKLLNEFQERGIVLKNDKMFND